MCVEINILRIKYALSVYLLLVPIALCLYNDPVIAYLVCYISHFVFVMGI